VSQSIARAYATRFGITVPEWRVLAVLGRKGRLTANEICDRSAMDKVKVSRAVSRMTASNLIERRTDRTDRRRVILTLSARGRHVYEQIVPYALDIESRLLDALSRSEREQLDTILGKLQSRARDLGRSD
jgi:DNA-binding MarR family transcriptional regulator